MTAPDLTPAERATVDRIEQAPDALGLHEEVAEVIGAHRVNYHHRNVGGETASTLRYTSCDGCDWLGGWHDEEGWEKHLADALLPLLERREAEAAERGVAVAAALLYKALDYWNGRPVEHHGHHIYADLCAVLREITPVDRDA